MTVDVLQPADRRTGPLRRRRPVLEELIASERRTFLVPRLSSECLRAWEQLVHRDYEGLVAKDPASPYVREAP